VGFSAETDDWYAGFVDVVFDNGFILRCATSGDSVIYCDDFSTRLDGWMHDLVNAGLTGNEPWLEAQVRRLDVDAPVTAVLSSFSSQMNSDFVTTFSGQASRWVFVKAIFDDGLSLTCRFRDAAPVIVDTCFSEGPGS